MDSSFKDIPLHKRGSHIRPGNRFESTQRENNWEDLEHEEFPESKSIKTEFIPDSSKTILTKNNSPDIGFTYSVNPYRGCEHGCAYCYARPTHETLGYNAGIDFESKIVVKHNAPELLRKALQKPSWQKETITMSGVTDCYQPAERRFRLTRGCLEVLLEFENPTTIVTKNVLLLRDLDILGEMAKKNLIQVYISVTSLDEQVQALLEPRTAKPDARLQAIRTLANHKIPVNVLVAPIIPGLTDHETPAILKAVAEAGATSADYALLRLPLSVHDVFLEWLDRNFPEKAGKVKHLLQEMRGGRLNDPNFGSRFVGQGPIAQHLATTFKVFCRKYGLAV